jgi:hypothetical protein
MAVSAKQLGRRLLDCEEERSVRGAHTVRTAQGLSLHPHFADLGRTAASFLCTPDSPYVERKFQNAIPLQGSSHCKFPKFCEGENMVHSSVLGALGPGSSNGAWSL